MVRFIGHVGIKGLLYGIDSIELDERGNGKIQW